MKKNIKSQAALEFLITYGWALLAVLVALASLAYFGVLNISSLLPGKCVLQSGLTCKEFKITPNAGPNQVQLVIQNSVGQPIDGVIVYVGEPCSANSGAPVSIDNGLPYEFNIDCGNAISEGKYQSDLNVTYSISGSTITRINAGEISGRTE